MRRSSSDHHTLTLLPCSLFFITLLPDSPSHFYTAQGLPRLRANRALYVSSPTSRNNVPLVSFACTHRRQGWVHAHVSGSTRGRIRRQRRRLPAPVGHGDGLRGDEHGRTSRVYCPVHEHARLSPCCQYVSHSTIIIIILLFLLLLLFVTVVIILRVVRWVRVQHSTRLSPHRWVRRLPASLGSPHWHRSEPAKDICRQTGLRERYRCVRTRSKGGGRQKRLCA